jgi:hypothetical protein
MTRPGNAEQSGSSVRQALVLLQLDGASFGSGRQAESLVRRILERERQVVGHEIASSLGAAVRDVYVELGSGTDIQIEHYSGPRSQPATGAARA